MIVIDLDMALNQLSSPDWSVRCNAVRMLGEFNEDRARAALEDALYDRDDTAVSHATVEVMVKTDDEGFLEPLVQAMTGGRPELSDEDASDVATHVYLSLMDHAGTRLATEALRRADETDPPRFRSQAERRRTGRPRGPLPRDHA